MPLMNPGFYGCFQETVRGFYPEPSQRAQADILLHKWQLELSMRTETSKLWT